MDAIAEYYIHQGDGGSGHQDDLFGMVYVVISYVQRASALAGTF
jgi:hypothetical protein